MVSGFARPFGVLLLVVLALSAPARAAPSAEIVMDVRNGAVLHARNADARLHPASLTKMMTLYLTFEAVRAGRLRLDRMVTISAHAASRPPSKLGLKAGQSVTVGELIRAAAIMSANDAATALGEAIAGSEREFGRMMTAKAAALGMRNSTFRNASGLTASGHLSSARDMAILARRLWFDFPEFYGVFGRTEAVAMGRPMRNTNALLSTYAGADGLKTGFTRPAGYNLAASAERDGRRIVAVLFGGRSSKARNARVAALLDLGFSVAGDRVPVDRPAPTREPLVAVSEPPPRRAAVPPTLAEIGVAALAEAVVPAAAAAAEVPAPPVRTASLAAPAESPRPAPRPALRRPATVPAARPAPPGWSVQLGAYKDRSFAIRTLARATALKVPELKGARQSVEAATVRGVKLYRARLTGLSQRKAQTACASLRSLDAPCRTVPPGDGR